MNFKVRIDDEARAFLPGVSSRNSKVELSDSELRISVGKELETRVDLTSVAQVRSIPNPEPEVFLPLGISAAVEQFGRDTVAAIGSHEGFVLLDFHRTIEARTLTAAAAAGEAKTSEQATIPVRHLILSLEEPATFVDAMNERLGMRERSNSAAG